MTEPAPADDVLVQLAHKPVATVVMIDPDTAARWLAHNAANRNVRNSQVSKYASDMAAGRWHLTGSPIQFAVDGRLLDGQHRLHAVIKSGMTVPMFVVRGLPTTAQAFMDTGAKRTVADQLGIAGYQHSSVLAAGARLALLWTSGRVRQTRSSISDAEIRAFVEDNPSLMEAAAFATQIRRSGLDVHPSVLCTAVWGLIEAGHVTEHVIGFFRAMADMRSDGPGDPKYALLQRIQTARRNRERIEPASMLSMLIRTYNADFTGKRNVRRVQVFVRNDVIDVPPIVSPDSWRANGPS